MFPAIKKSARLGQWDGRTRSSRSEGPLWPRLWQRPVLVRLAVVLGTVFLATLLALRPGGTHVFRVGESPPFDLRARISFDRPNVAQTEHLRDEAVAALPPDRREIDGPAARKQVADVIDHYAPGTQLAPRGQPLTSEQLVLFQEESRAYNRSRTTADHLTRFASLFLVFTMLSVMVVLYVVRFQQSLAQSLSKVISVSALVLITLILCLILHRPPWHAVLIPLVMTSMILTFAYNPQFALLMSLSLSLTAVLSMGGWLTDLLVVVGGQATAILALRSIRTRSRLIEVGCFAGLACMAMTMATGLQTGQTWKLIVGDGLRNLGWGAMAGFLVCGLLPLLERCFGVVTDVRLLELGDGSHPLLQELVRRAPGTYTHSMTVATLAEPAAEAIGASPLLARVGSYFHDVGKMLKPHYFIENQTGENRHDALEPALSTLIIIGHVKDGVALAEQYGLPRPLVEFIEQHHGTTLVEYFYREALRQQQAQGNRPTRAEGEPDPLEATFRYPGPKPQSREAAVVMLADSVESASRALSMPTPGSLKKLVRDLLMKRLIDGQFDESGMTLSELHIVEESLVKGLVALYHSRIKYPEADHKKAG